MPQNIGDNRISEIGIARIKDTDASRLKRYLVRKGDIVYSRRGDVERRALIRDHEDGWLCGTGCLRVRFGDATVDSEYAAYYLGHPAVRAWIVGHAQGATMPNLNTGILSALPFVVPPLHDQHAIASILGALDDKIELNRKMSETLESMARAIFTSWFVDFDPVRAKAEGRHTGLATEIASLFPDSFEKTARGDIPNGWLLGTIDDLCDSITSGGTPARMTEEYWLGGDIPWFKTGELKDCYLVKSSEHITKAGLTSSSAKLWPAETILFALYASPTVGRMGILTLPATSNQAAAGLKSKCDTGMPFLFEALFFARGELQNISVGAAQQNINLGILKTHRLLLPSPETRVMYSNLAKPMFERRRLLQLETGILGDLRDTLLPKLISGELRVAEAERILEKSA